jgi:hypothetical protein
MWLKIDPAAGTGIFAEATGVLFINLLKSDTVGIPRVLWELSRMGLLHFYYTSVLFVVVQGMKQNHRIQASWLILKALADRGDSNPRYTL